jgi:hypothetical protein
MLLKKFSLMNPAEVDRYEELQQTVFRPASIKDTPRVAKNLLDQIRSKSKIKSGTPEEKLNVRLTNRLKGNAHIRSLGNKEFYLERISNSNIHDPMDVLVLDLLKLDTNKGNFYQEQNMQYLFTDGAKATEKEAKQRLIEEFGLDPNKFLLLPDAGLDAIYLSEKQNKLVRAGDVNERIEGRSVDALTALPNCYIAWVMKYAGGTAGVDGSGQTDQKTTEGIKYSKIFESAYQSCIQISYNDKRVFMGYMVYGSQFTNSTKRIVQNELGFKRDYDCKRSFNITISRVKDVIDYLELQTQFDNSLEEIYNRYGYDIAYTGRPKQKELNRLTEWTMN